MSYVYRYNDEPDALKVAPKLRTDRTPWKVILLAIVTLSFYELFFFSSISFDIDKIAQRSDGKKTMNYALAIILALFTFSIVMLVWFHQICVRIDDALSEREIDYDFGARTYWLWAVCSDCRLGGVYM